jgi:hypothetical protein
MVLAEVATLSVSTLHSQQLGLSPAHLQPKFGVRIFPSPAALQEQKFAKK